MTGHGIVFAALLIRGMAQESAFSLNSKGEALLRFFLYLYKNINGKERL